MMESMKRRFDGWHVVKHRLGTAPIEVKKILRKNNIRKVLNQATFRKKDAFGTLNWFIWLSRISALGVEMGLI